MFHRKNSNNLRNEQGKWNFWKEAPSWIRFEILDKLPKSYQMLNNILVLTYHHHDNIYLKSFLELVVSLKIVTATRAPGGYLSERAPES